jgi:hypothetical protein
MADVLFERAFDLDIINSNYPNTSGLAIAPRDAALCAPAINEHVILHGELNETAADLTVTSPTDLMLQMFPKDKPIIALHAAATFYDLDRTGILPMYAMLWAQPDVQKAANEFVAREFKGKPFVAIHLRWAEGECAGRGGGVMCAPPPEVLDAVLNFTTPQLLGAPIFVATDHQRKDVLQKYIDRGAKTFPASMLANKDHLPIEDFEIAARANMFIGVSTSTASMTIACLRQYRFLGEGPNYPAAVGWYPERAIPTKRGCFMF